MNEQKPQLELGDQKGELSCPLTIAEPNRKKEKLLFPNKDSTNEKPWTEFTTTLPASFFSVLAGCLSLPV